MLQALLIQKMIDLSTLLLGFRWINHFLLIENMGSRALSCFLKYFFTANSQHAAARGRPAQPRTRV